MKNLNSTIAITAIVLLSIAPFGLAGSDNVVPPWERIKGDTMSIRIAIVGAGGKMGFRRNHNLGAMGRDQT